jgi:hypothetical protein
MTFCFKPDKLLGMNWFPNKKIVLLALIVLLITIFVLSISYFIFLNNKKISPITVEQNRPELYKYQGKIYNIFFHSLIVYPQLAFDGDINSDLYKKYMVTRDEFNKILAGLYKNNFVLIDISSIYKIGKNGAIYPKDIYLPLGKKPLIISIDDLSYYKSMSGHGFANKLVIGKDGNIATEIITPDGKKEITRDGDIVPILDDFVKAHPDFSINNAKGVIALTGYEGILGYRTEDTTSANYDNEIQSAKSVIERLKATGWKFASHSYSHDKTFSTGKTSLEYLTSDTKRWDKEVRPLIGETNIFVGPYGQIFKHNDLMQTYLISKGFKVFYGVGIDLYTHFYPDCLEMDRVDIDGFRLKNNSDFLKIFFDTKNVLTNNGPK